MRMNLKERLKKRRQKVWKTISSSGTLTAGQLAFFSYVLKESGKEAKSDEWWDGVEKLAKYLNKRSSEK